MSTDARATPMSGAASRAASVMSGAASRAASVTLPVVVLTMAHTANDAFTSMFPALLPTLGQRLGLAGGELAILVAVFSLSTSLPQPFFGMVADRLGGRVVGAIGLALTAAFAATLGHVATLSGLVALLVVGGLGSAAMHPASIGLVRASGAGRPGTMLAVFAASGMLGGAVGPVAVLAVVATLGTAGIVWLAVPGVILAVLVYRLAPRRARGATRLRVPFMRTFTHGSMPGLVLVVTLTTLAFMTFTNAVPQWLVTERGLGSQSPVIGWTLATFAAAAAVGGLLADTLARRIGRRLFVAATLTSSFIALLGVLASRPGDGAYYALVALAGALLFAHTPLLVLTAQEQSPGAESAAAGVMFGVTAAAGGLLFALLGQWQDALGIGTMLVLSFSALPAAAAIVSMVLRPAPAPEAANCLTAMAIECHTDECPCLPR